jgi:hypothetical protein
VIMGSQSILASYSVAALNPDLLMSAEVDIMPVDADAAEIERLSDHLHGSLGQDSSFQEAFGFHVDGITIDTSVLPQGWVYRLIPAVDPASGATAWCLDPHDLAIAKLIAGRSKDLDLVDRPLGAECHDAAGLVRLPAHHVEPEREMQVVVDVRPVEVGDGGVEVIRAR